MLDRSSLGSDEWRPVYADLKEGAASDGVPPARTEVVEDLHHLQRPH
jgi:hypothetical protein